jgi:hypothetical protein
MTGRRRAAPVVTFGDERIAAEEKCALGIRFPLVSSRSRKLLQCGSPRPFRPFRYQIVSDSMSSDSPQGLGLMASIGLLLRSGSPIGRVAGSVLLVYWRPTQGGGWALRRSRRLVGVFGASLCASLVLPLLTNVLSDGVARVATKYSWLAWTATLILGLALAVTQARSLGPRSRRGPPAPEQLAAAAAAVAVAARQQWTRELAIPDAAHVAPIPVTRLATPAGRSEDPRPRCPSAQARPEPRLPSPPNPRHSAVGRRHTPHPAGLRTGCPLAVTRHGADGGMSGRSPAGVSGDVGVCLSAESVARTSQRLRAFSVADAVTTSRSRW